MPTSLDAAVRKQEQPAIGTPVPRIRPETPAEEPIRLRRIVACVDGSSSGDGVLAHAARAASALDAELTVLRVVTPSAALPMDPVAWDVRVREARADVLRLAAEAGTATRHVEAAITEGEAAEQIRQWTRQHSIDLTVIGTNGESGITDWGLGSTARKLIDRMPGSLLLVPPSVRPSTTVAYRSILVPLDGSSHAESVLPLATLLAEDNGARLVLAHVVPVPELTETAPMESEARELRERLVQRNRRVAEEYLERMRANAPAGAEVRTIAHAAGVRAGLEAIIADERPDLIVLSAYGRGRRAGVPFGSVAGYLIGRATVPLLVVRGRQTAPARASAAPSRLPVYAGR